VFVGPRPTLQQIAGGSVLDLKLLQGAPRGAQLALRAEHLVAPHVVWRRRLAGGQGRLAVGQRDPQILDQLCGGGALTGGDGRGVLLLPAFEVLDELTSANERHLQAIDPGLCLGPQR
jgi:hypothetical protein